MNYLETINHETFRSVCRTVHRCEERLQKEMGMTLEQARSWIRAWASSAGDGAA